MRKYTKSAVLLIVYLYLAYGAAFWIVVDTDLDLNGPMPNSDRYL